MHRNLRKMRVSELARAVGVTPSLISQIERGSTRPSVATLFALAEALDVSVDVFADRAAGHALEPAPATAHALAPRPARESRYVVRRPDRRSIAIDGGIRWELLSPETEPDVEFLEIVYEPHAESSPTLYRHPGKELVRVVTGAFEIHIGFDVFRLEEGDSIDVASVAYELGPISARATDLGKFGVKRLGSTRVAGCLRRARSS